MTFDSRPDTLRHIGLVQRAMSRFITSLKIRSEQHDLSKLQEPEKSAIDAVRPILKTMKYGTPEYTALKYNAFGKHHFEVNDHHVEHFPGGLFNMTLEQLVEMYCDWVAAVQTNGPEDNIYASIRNHEEMLGPVVSALFRNQSKEWGL